MPRALSIIYASTSGNTEYVVETLTKHMHAHCPGIRVESLRSELATTKDLLLADVAILASGTWNFGGVEGQLNMHMHDFLFSRAQNVDLAGKQLAFISLGDNRYYYTTRCTEHFQKFLKTHNGKQLLPPLVIVNDPSGQEDKIKAWAEKLCHRMLDTESQM